MLKFSHVFDGELRGIGKLLRIKVPLGFIEKTEMVRLDHIWWDGNFIQIHAEVTNKVKYQEPDALILSKYRIFDKPIEMS